nr:hypothetical protein [Tanacetum cinerariifolium]
VSSSSVLLQLVAASDSRPSSAPVFRKDFIVAKRLRLESSVQVEAVAAHGGRLQARYRRVAVVLVEVHVFEALVAVEIQQVAPNQRHRHLADEGVGEQALGQVV